MRLYRNVLFPYRDICPYNPLKRDSHMEVPIKLVRINVRNVRGMQVQYV